MSWRKRRQEKEKRSAVRLVPIEVVEMSPSERRRFERAGIRVVDSPPQQSPLLFVIPTDRATLDRPDALNISGLFGDDDEEVLRRFRRMHGLAE